MTFSNTRQSGGTVYGMAGSVQVVFTTLPSTGDDAQQDSLIINPNGAPQRSIGAVDQSVNNLLITVPGYTFTDFKSDFYGDYSNDDLTGEQCDHNAMHPINVSVTTNDGTSPTYVYSNPNAGPACHNEFAITTKNGEAIDSIFIGNIDPSDAAKFYALSGLAFSGLTPNNALIPEPDSLLLLGTGLAPSIDLTALRGFTDDQITALANSLNSIQGSNELLYQLQVSVAEEMHRRRLDKLRGVDAAGRLKNVLPE